jgi:hypothetical protein
MAEPMAIRTVLVSTSPGRGSRTKIERPSPKCTTATGRRKLLKLGIRLDMRWLSTMETTAMRAADANAAYTQLTGCT